MQIGLIVPVYNSEQFLDNCFQSIERQTVFLEEKLNVIFVDDGSTDSSLSMLKKFQERFPEKVDVLVQKNQGPSAARNHALRNISSKIDIIGFLDSDDSLEHTCIEKVIRFFEINYLIEVGTIPRVFFGRLEGDHPLNSRFNTEEETISIELNPFSPQFFVGGTFIRTSLLKRLDLTFDESLHYFEDALFVTQLLLDTGEYGLIKDTAYYYHKRESEDSLVDLHRLNGFPFLNLIKKGYNPLIQYSQKKYGKTIPYVQFLIMYHLRLSFRKRSQKLFEELPTNERKEFITAFGKLIQEVDEETIEHLPLKKYEAEYLLYKLNQKNKDYAPITVQNIMRKRYNLEFTCSTLKEPKSYLQVSRGVLADEKTIEKRTFKLFGQYICNHRIEFKVSLNLFSFFTGTIVCYQSDSEVISCRKLSFMSLMLEYLKRNSKSSQEKLIRTYSISDVNTLNSRG